MENQDLPLSQLGIPGLGLVQKPAQPEQPIATDQAAKSAENTTFGDQIQPTLPTQGIVESLPDSSHIQIATDLPQETKDQSLPESPSLISALEARLEGLAPGETKSEDIDELATREPDVINTAVEIQNGADTTMMDVPSEAPGEAEFEADSSPYESSSDDSSDDSSSSDDSDDGEDAYPLLTPEEQARILMQDDGGSDDEGAKKSSSGHLRTKNEISEEVVSKPDVTVTPEMKIIELGPVESIVENIALIKAKVSGEYQVLESNSVLCLEDRSVIGVVSDTLGPVQQPLYCVRFTNSTEIAAAGVTVGTQTFYVEAHSTYVFTQALKAKKGTDASNIYDEEVGDDEMEFSDDEKEMEHKRRIKQNKMERRNGNNDSESGRGRRGPPTKKWQESGASENIGLTHEDDIDGPYKTLARPASFAENVMRPEAPQENQSGRYYSQTKPNLGAPNTGRSRGRDDRGRGRGRARGSDRGGRGGGYQDRHNDNRGGYSLPPKPQGGAPPVPHYSPNNYGYNPQGQQQFFQPPTWPQPAFPSVSLPSPSSQFPFQGMQQPQWPQMQMPPGVGGAPQLPTGGFFNPAFFGTQVPNQPQGPNPWGQTPSNDGEGGNGNGIGN